MNSTIPMGLRTRVPSIDHPRLCRKNLRGPGTVRQRAVASDRRPANSSGRWLRQSLSQGVRIGEEPSTSPGDGRCPEGPRRVRFGFEPTGPPGATGPIGRTVHDPESQEHGAEPGPTRPRTMSNTVDIPPIPPSAMRNAARVSGAWRRVNAPAELGGPRCPPHHDLRDRGPGPDALLPRPRRRVCWCSAPLALVNRLKSGLSGALPRKDGRENVVVRRRIE